MKHLIIGFSIAASLASSAAAATQRSEAWSLDRIVRIAAPEIETISDITSWLGSKPDPIPEFDYSETRRFDMQLHQSMGADLETINVKVGGDFGRDDVPERMSRWLKTIQKGGSMRTCVVADNSKSFLAIAKLLFRGIDAADSWLLYRPARKYDAMMIVGSDGDEVLNVVFGQRGTLAACPAGTVSETEAAQKG